MRQLIVKLAYMDGKTAIYKGAKNSKKHNRTRRELKQGLPYVVMTEYLPRAFQE